MTSTVLRAILAPPVAIPIVVGDESLVGEARRVGDELAGSLSMPSQPRGRLALVVTELTRNLVRHTLGGRLHLRPLLRGGVAGVEVIGVDRGPGMADVARCLVDGDQARGTGLGAILRLADETDLVSQVPTGTVLAARVFAAPPPPSPLVGAALLPAAGARACRADVAVVEAGGRTLILVAEGERGPAGVADARRATGSLIAALPTAPGALRAAQDALGPRRAALAAAEIPHAPGELRFATVGDLTAQVLLPGGARTIVGPRVEAAPWPPGALLILASANLALDRRIDDYAELTSRDPALLAAMLLRDLAPASDDAIVAIVRL
jgi:anti-sigma regulatory factor (Ser/Thr protein kinase)